MISKENRIKADNMKKLMSVGLLPSYYDQSKKDEKSTKIRKKNEKFSTVHNTRAEYNKDIELAFEYDIKGIPIPDDLIKRLKQTGIEIGKIDRK